MLRRHSTRTYTALVLVIACTLVCALHGVADKQSPSNSQPYSITLKCPEDGTDVPANANNCPSCGLPIIFVRGSAGLFKLPDGVRYKGERLYGIPHGIGIIYSTNGVDTLGRSIQSDAFVYRGHFQAGVIEGDGDMVQQDKTVSFGTFSNGFLYATGMRKYAEGAYYVGSFVADQPSGRGLFYWPNGASFAGIWSGTGEALGQMTDKNGRKLMGRLHRFVFTQQKATHR